MGFLDKLKGTAKQAVSPGSQHEQALAGITVGGDVVVKVDSDDPQSLLVWGAAG